MLSVYESICKKNYIKLITIIGMMIDNWQVDELSSLFAFLTFSPVI